jgi:hypothetical protein
MIQVVKNYINMVINSLRAQETNRMKKKCKHQTNNGWCKARGGTCIWSEYTPEACLKREEV